MLLIVFCIYLHAGPLLEAEVLKGDVEAGLVHRLLNHHQRRKYAELAVTAVAHRLPVTEAGDLLVLGLAYLLHLDRRKRGLPQEAGWLAEYLTISSGTIMALMYPLECKSGLLGTSVEFNPIYNRFC